MTEQRGIYGKDITTTTVRKLLQQRSCGRNLDANVKPLTRTLSTKL